MRRATVIVITVVLVAMPAAAQRTIRGTTRDSASAAPLAGALVEVRSATQRRVDRTDEEGAFRLRNLPPGTYRLSVLRIGFREWRGVVEVGARDTSLVLSLAAVPQRLDAFLVRGDIGAVYGMVGTLPDLLPLAEARVQVIGANREQVTDSTGGFFIPVDPPGIYMVRMTREGYAERMLTIAVPRGRAVDGSRFLDPGKAPPKGLDGLYKDLDQRIRQQTAASAALVPGSELRRAGTSVIDALAASPSFAAKGLRFADSACVFVNGVPRPGVSPDAFSPDEIESIEVYGASPGFTGGVRDPRSFVGSGTADKSGSLGDRWPMRAPCGPNSGRRLPPPSRRPTGPMQSGIVKFVVIWLRT